MGTTNGGTITLEGPRICSECKGLGIWQGDRSGDKLIIECVRDDCQTTWTAPNRTEGGEI